MKIKILILFILITGIYACTNSPSKYIYNKGFVYGTMYTATYESPNGEDFQEEINEEFKKLTMIFSTYEKESTISKINNNETVKPEPLFLECYNRAMEISEITNGAFDISAGPLVNAWGFGPEEKKKMTQQKVDSLLQITGFQKIKFENGEFKKEHRGMKLDMSAIAKGFTSDLIADFLAQKGCENYMVEIGGEVMAKGKNAKGRFWTIGISKPEEDLLKSTSDLQAILQLQNCGMATSGNYRNFYEEDGKRYAHTIDPKTGYPVQHSLLSATVLAEDCMTADAYATAFMVLGKELGIEIARQVPGLEIYFIYVDEKGENQVYMSEGFAQYLVN
ncbi:MAG: FAD:protein FMN transferase [Draconibacterium sp.]|nr:FAD:protein FMN transferase [Draconibacterium sp.]